MSLANRLIFTLWFLSLFSSQKMGTKRNEADAVRAPALLDRFGRDYSRLGRTPGCDGGPAGQRPRRHGRCWPRPVRSTSSSRPAARTRRLASGPRSVRVGTVPLPRRWASFSSQRCFLDLVFTPFWSQGLIIEITSKRQWWYPCQNQTRSSAGCQIFPCDDFIDQRVLTAYGMYLSTAPPFAWFLLYQKVKYGAERRNGIPDSHEMSLHGILTMYLTTHA